MGIIFMNQKLASFKYGGSIKELIISHMKKTGDGVYTAKYEKGLIVTLKIKSVLPEVLEWVVDFENAGDENTFQISNVLGLDIELPSDTASEVVWRSLNGDSCDGNSFMYINKRIPVGARHHVEPSLGRSSNTTAFPYFDMAYGNKGLVCGIGWSGQWQLDICRDTRFISLKAGQQDSDFYLKSGETARSTRVIVMTGRNDTDKLCRDFRRMHRTSYSPANYLGNDFEMPLSIQTFDRYFNTTPEFATEPWQLKLISCAARCGTFNTFWIDAAWFKDGFPSGVGNYKFAKGFPNGLINISNKAHENRMKFMVWFEPERICKGSDIYKKYGNDNYHAWLLDSGDNNPDTKLFNLGNSEARQWLLETLSKFIKDNGVDIYRQDFNMDPLTYWRAADEEGRKGLTEMKYMEGLYWLWDSLIERFPSLLIDNCASGGRRIDFETCMRSVPLWRSDTASGPANGLFHQNQTMTLSRYLPYHCVSTWFEDAYEFRSGATMGVACAFDFLNKNYNYSAAIASTQELQRIRKYWNGDFYALTDVTYNDNVWAAYQLNCADAGFCMIFRRGSSEDTTKLIKLFGLDSKLKYTVTFSDDQYKTTQEIISGEELTNGISVVLPDKKTSLMIEYSSK